MLYEEWDLSVHNNKLFLYCSEWNYLFNENRLLSNNLFEYWNLCMAGNLNDSFLDIRLHKVTLLDNYFLWILFIYWFFDFNHHCFRLLTIAMFWVINWFFNHNFCNFCNFMPFNYRLLNLNKLYFFLNHNMMNWSLHNFEFRLFVNFRNSLLYFENFIYLFIDILGHFPFNHNLSCLNLRCVIRNFYLSLDLLGC